MTDMLAKKDVQDVMKVWEFSSSGRPKSYDYQDLLRRLRKIRPDAVELIRELRHDKYLYSDERGCLVLTEKGRSFLPARPADNSSPIITSSESDWADFRRLLSYYIDCVRSEDRREYYLNVDKQGRDFCIPGSVYAGWSHALVKDRPSRIALSFKPQDFPILTALENREPVCVGYPLEVHFDANGDVYRYVPVTLTPVKYVESLPGGRLANSPRNARVELCLDKSSFNFEWVKRNCDDLYLDEMLEELDKVCDPFDVEMGLPILLSYSSYNRRLNEFSPDCLVQALPKVQRKGQRRVLSNTFALFRMQSTVFNKGLLNELEAVEKARAEDLDKTALAYIYRKTPLPDEAASNYTGIPFIQSNSEQLEAVESAFEHHVSVLQGPPGTGKSQVAVNILANAAYQGKSVCFSSRNHAALDVVIERARSTFDYMKSPMLYSCGGSNGNVGDWYDLDPIGIANTLKIQVPPMASYAVQAVDESSENIGRIKADAAMESNVLTTYLAAEDEFLVKEHELRHLLRYKGAASDLEDLLRSCNRVVKVDKSFIGWLKSLISRDESTTDAVASVKAYCTSVRLPIDDASVNKLCVSAASKSKDYFEAKNRMEEAYKQYKAGCQSDDDHAIAYNEELNTIEKYAKDALLGKRGESVSWISSDQLDWLKGQMQFEKNTRHRTRKDEEDSIEAVKGLHVLAPCWSVPLLSARHVAPLAPGVFDLVVIDEASQCDCVSIIPMLFRAKNAVVIGDPAQFRPVITMSKPRHQRIWNKHFGEDRSFFDFSYFTNSAYSVVASHATRLMLKEHFRCAEGIAAYFNEMFYGGELRVRSGEHALECPSVYKGKEAIQWIDICTGIIDEIMACIGELKRVRGCGFKGSIGVISPYRNNADKAANLIMEAGFSPDDVKVDSVYGFQGGECDVIFFLIGFREHARNWYLTSAENDNIFNVAISRAKSNLVIIGDKERCKNSGSHALELLAGYPKTATTAIRFESPWEKCLFDALVENGIHTYPQYAFHGYRFDLAYIEGDTKLDIEVDGYSYHFNSDGSRKSSDLRRDAAIEAYGWKPVRFVVKELMDDLQGCVFEVKEMIKKARMVQKTRTMISIPTQDDVKDSLLKAMSRNHVFMDMDYDTGDGLVDFASTSGDKDFAVLISTTKSSKDNARLKQVLIRKGWNVMEIAERDILDDVDAVVGRMHDAMLH